MEQNKEDKQSKNKGLSEGTKQAGKQATGEGITHCGYGKQKARHLSSAELLEVRWHELCTHLSHLITNKPVLRSGLMSIYPRRELAERSAVSALNYQRHGGLIALWIGYVPRLLSPVSTTSCGKIIR